MTRPNVISPELLVFDPTEQNYYRVGPITEPLTPEQLRGFCGIQNDTTACKLMGRTPVFDGEALASLYAVKNASSSMSKWYLHLEGLMAYQSPEGDDPFILSDNVSIKYREQTIPHEIGRTNILGRKLSYRQVRLPVQLNTTRFLRVPALTMWSCIPYEFWGMQTTVQLLDRPLGEAVQEAGIAGRLFSEQYDLYFPVAGHRRWSERSSDIMDNARLTPHTFNPELCKYLKPATHSDIVFEFRNRRMSIFSAMLDFRIITPAVRMSTATLGNIFDSTDACMDDETKDILHNMSDYSEDGILNFMIRFLHQFFSGEFNNDAGGSGTMEAMAIVVKRGKDPADPVNQLPLGALANDRFDSIPALTFLRRMISSGNDVFTWHRKAAEAPLEPTFRFPSYERPRQPEDGDDDNDDDNDDDEEEEEEEEENTNF